MFVLSTLAAPRSHAANGEEASKDGAPPVVPLSAVRAEGRRIESGLRVETKEGRVRVASRTFPLGGAPQGLELPAHLGGGFVFFQPLAADGHSGTAFYRARTWTGPLEPLARVPFPVRHVEAGFDRLYLFGVTLQVALDHQSGKVLPLDPLPPSITIEGLAFDGPERALVAAPLSGVRYTEDSGQTWTSIPEAQDVQVNLRDSDLLVRTERGIEVVGASGKLITGDLSSAQFAPLDAFLSGYRTPPSTSQKGERATGDGEASRAFGGSAATPMLSSSARELAFLGVLTRGVRVGKKAIALVDGDRVELSLDAGLQLTTTRADQIERHSHCLGIEGPRTAKKGRPLFVCQSVSAASKKGAHGSATVFALDSPTRLRRVHVHELGTDLLAKGPGAVLLRGACEPQGKKSPRRACHVTSRGKKSVTLPAVKRLTSEAFAISQDEVWRVALEQDKRQVVASRLDRTLEVERVYRVAEEGELSAFLRDGSLLPHGSVMDAELAIWSVLGERFVGIRLGESETPMFGPVQRPLGRALFDGPRALVWGAAGFAKQSMDGGLTFAELELPYTSGDPELPYARSTDALVSMGCSEVGCALGRLLRFGFEVPKSPRVEVPPLSPLPSDPSGRFVLSCGKGDQLSAPRRAVGQGEFPAFWEKSAPTVEAGSEGVATGFPGDLAHLYAWGPSEGNWSRSGRAQAYFVDPYRPGTVLESSSTKRLFESLMDAKTKMGTIDRSAATQSSFLDPSGKSGLLVLGERTSFTLLGVFENKPIEPYYGADELGLRQPVSVVDSRGTLVAAFRQGTVLRVVRLSGGRVELLADLSVGDSGDRGVSLVRTTEGDLGVAMDGDRGLFVYPLSDDGVLGQPIVTDTLGARPGVCPPEALGYIVDRELVVAPYIESTDGRPLPVTRLRGRFIVGYGKPCIEGVIGYSRGAAPPTAPPARPEVPLTILDTDAQGRRTRLLCE